MKFKKPLKLTWFTETPGNSWCHGRIILVTVSDNGNTSLTTASTLTNIPVQTANTEQLMYVVRCINGTKRNDDNISVRECFTGVKQDWNRDFTIAFREYLSKPVLLMVSPTHRRNELWVQ
jgi:hypothetical protein